MPKNCGECPLLNYHSPCWKNGGAVDWENRPNWCPLIEVPPHGRLIDADALTTVTEMVNGKWKTYLEVFEITDAPTIIEAEGEDG